MASEDVCDTGLALGLAIGGGASTRHRRREKPEKPGGGEEGEGRRFGCGCSVGADGGGGGREGGDVVAGASDAEEEDGGVRKKLRLTKEQSALLEERFKEHSTLNPKQKQALAKQLNLRPRQVEVWFQNRRARTKLKQTEVDCEFLKKCCETLTDENRRLQKELQELRALKFAAAAAGPGRCRRRSSTCSSRRPPPSPCAPPASASAARGRSQGREKADRRRPLFRRRAAAAAFLQPLHSFRRVLILRQKINFNDDHSRVS
uniref:Homeobox domain-containing protein n=1 Tax=Ananas comosus var. bracteatus TaxID=296719 RepID=A0A6V7Q359_ANACO|nr:unnamed protein product [Ananas comosus var. bracteatus]